MQNQALARLSNLNISEVYNANNIVAIQQQYAIPPPPPIQRIEMGNEVKVRVKNQSVLQSQQFQKDFSLIKHQMMTAEASKNVSALSGANNIQIPNMAESQAKAMQIIDSSRIKIKPAAVTTI
jgi:hypothetical protein